MNNTSSFPPFPQLPTLTNIHHLFQTSRPLSATGIIRSAFRVRRKLSILRDPPKGPHQAGEQAISQKPRPSGWHPPYRTIEVPCQPVLVGPLRGDRRRYQGPQRNGAWFPPPHLPPRDFVLSPLSPQTCSLIFPSACTPLVSSLCLEPLPKFLFSKSFFF